MLYLLHINVLPSTVKIIRPYSTEYINYERYIRKTVTKMYIIITIHYSTYLSLNV